MNFNFSAFEKTALQEARAALKERLEQLDGRPVWIAGFDCAEDFSHLFPFCRSVDGMEEVASIVDSFESKEEALEGLRSALTASRGFEEHARLESAMPKTERALETFSKRLASALTLRDSQGDPEPLEALLGGMRERVAALSERLAEEGAFGSGELGQRPWIVSLFLPGSLELSAVDAAHG